MIKILYAADNRYSSFYSLKRFIDTYSKFFNIRTAAYSKSIQDINVNWNLDALLDFRGEYNSISFKNSNFPLYIREIKKYSPHLIISDIEIYSSYIGIELGIPVWQVSPLLLYYGAEDKNNLYKYHAGIFSSVSDRYKYLNFILNNSDKKLVLSHLGDTNHPPKLCNGYEWVRPNYELLNTNDDIVYTIGTGIDLADAYYSNKCSITKIDYTDPEVIIATYFNSLYALNIASKQEYAPFEPTINPDIKFLSQYIKELDI